MVTCHLHYLFRAIPPLDLKSSEDNILAQTRFQLSYPARKRASRLDFSDDRANRPRLVCLSSLDDQQPFLPLHTMSSPRPRSLATGSPSNINPYLSTSPFKNPPALPNIPLRSTPSNPSTPNDSAFAPPAASSSSASVVDGERKIVQPQPQPASNLSASMRQQTPLSLAGLAPSPNHLSPAVQSPADSSSAGDPFSSAFNLEAATEEEKANILRRHLVSAQERRASNAAGAARPDMGNLSRASSFRNDNESAVEGREGPGEEGEEFQLPYNQAGGDVT
jgi:proton-coupled amino acid transporter